MVGLPEEYLQCLIDLIEEKLARMTAELAEESSEYRELQNCRYTLIVMAARADADRMATPVVSDFRDKSSHLRAITGGKS